MQTISIRTTQNVVINYPLAGVGDRILAYIIDSFIVSFYAVIAWVFFIYALLDLDLGKGTLAIIGAILILPIMFYHFLFESFMDCQTPGKRAMNIRIVRLDGSNPTIGTHFLRWLCRIIDIGPVGVVLIAATEKSQRLGDLAAGTTVVKVIREEQITATQVFVTPDDGYSPMFPQVSQLEPRDIELVQRALEAYRDFENYDPIMITSERLKTVLGIQTHLDPQTFLNTIVKDYNHLASR